MAPGRADGEDKTISLFTCHILRMVVNLGEIFFLTPLEFEITSL